MNVKKIQRLIELVEKSEISELEVSRWGTRVRVTKYPPLVTHTAPVSAPPPSHPSREISVPAKPAFRVESPPAALESAPKSTSTARKNTEILAPMVGTFYRSPAPDVEPFVKVGDMISPGQVLCIIEAMKLMNEIEAECSGKLVDILVQNAQPVEYNQVLFVVEPAN
ncbi:acetyl-CoA carboxylase biotin carboxyl carrier protein [candidate division KSB1 bacterium]|nr:acetyl-CoA carboxylase biotin carboxyl carrier protein [candidate division KSB1 bacterium]